MQVGNRMAMSEEQEPTRAHLALLAIYTTIVGAAALVLRRRRRLALPKPQDLLLLGVGTFKLSRLITRERVTQALREPFAEAVGPGAASEIMPKPKGTGIRKAIGELLSCPFCASVWIGTAGTLSFATAPDATRLAASALTSMAVADAAQYGLAGLRKIEG
jgi:hypothetical protein